VSLSKKRSEFSHDTKRKKELTKISTADKIINTLFKFIASSGGSYIYKLLTVKKYRLYPLRYEQRKRGATNADAKTT